MEGLNIYVKVRPVVKQYFTELLQQDVIRPVRGSVLLDIVKPHLELLPIDAVDLMHDEKETITIELPSIREKITSHSTKQPYWCNTLWRHHLSDKGQACVRRHFDKTMKAAFHTFMDGYTIGVNETKVRSGVTEFFLEYRIEFTETDISSYTRDWFRYRKRKNEERITPLIY